MCFFGVISQRLNSDAGRLPKKHNTAFNTRRKFEIKIKVSLDYYAHILISFHFPELSYTNNAYIQWNVDLKVPLKGCTVKVQKWTDSLWKPYPEKWKHCYAHNSTVHDSICAGIWISSSYVHEQKMVRVWRRPSDDSVSILELTIAEASHTAYIFSDIITSKKPLQIRSLLHKQKYINRRQNGDLSVFRLNFQRHSVCQINYIAKCCLTL